LTGESIRDKLRENRPQNAGNAELIYTDESWKQIGRDVALAYKWPLVAVCGLLTLSLWQGWVGLDMVPVEAWSMVYYAVLGSFAAGPLGYWLVLRWEDPIGQEIDDRDPVGHRHRHLRLGPELVEKLEVMSPWGEEVSINSLQDVTINGRSGYECMDFRVTPDGTPTCVATWMGEESSTQFRTYKNAYSYAHKRLARRADKKSMLRANQGEIVREACERAITELIRTSERSGMPHGEEIDAVVRDVMDDAGLGDPLDNDRDRRDRGGVERDDDDADRRDHDRREDSGPAPGEPELPPPSPTATDGGTER
jgi:hypothetical protein